MVNDAAPPIWAFQPELKPGVECVIASDARGPLALFLLARREADPSTAEVHFSALPVTWGRSTSLVASFLGWVWENMPLDILIGKIPSYNRLTLRLAKEVGFEEMLVCRAVGMRRGNPYDLIELAVVRPSK